MKPANVLITRNGEAKVTDFGVSRLAYTLSQQSQMEKTSHESESITLSSLREAAGSLPYMSPEQCRNESLLDIRSDIYSFGCLLYEMLIGDKLFKAFDFQMYAHLHTTVAPDLSRLDQIPFGGELKAIIGRCCEKSKTNRYQNFGELGNELRALYTRFTRKTLFPETTVKQDVGELVNAGIMKIQLNQFQNAITLFDQILEQDPQCIPALNSKAVALRRLQRFDEALVCCDHALELDPNQVHTLILKGTLLSDQDKAQDAIKYFDQALAIEVDNAISWNNRGNAFARLGNFQEALKSHERALAINSDYLEARLNLCTDLFNTGDMQRFIKTYDEVKHIAPDHPGVQKLANIRALFPDNE